MGILAKIKRALEKHEVSALKKKIDRLVSALKKKIVRLGMEATEQGKTVESLTIVLNTCSGSLPNRFEYVLSDGTTNKQRPTKNPSRVAPVGESKSKSKPGLRPTLVGKSCDYDEKSMWVEDYEEAGFKVFLVVRKDGIRDIFKVRCGTMSVPQSAIWWIENKEKVCNKFNVTATPPSKAPLISFSVI